MEIEPDIAFCGLSLWVRGRERPDASEYYDGNWLLVKATMKVSGAYVECSGPFLMTADILSFRNGLALMADHLNGEARLEGLEPGIKALLAMQPRGQIRGTIEITPDHLTQQHHFAFDTDQSYLSHIIASCDDVLKRFPVNGTPGP